MFSIWLTVYYLYVSDYLTGDDSFLCEWEPARVDTSYLGYWIPLSSQEVSMLYKIMFDSNSCCVYPTGNFLTNISVRFRLYYMYVNCVLNMDD